MEQLVTLTVLQILIDTLVQKNYLSTDEKIKIYKDSADILEEIKPQNQNQDRVLTDAIRYLTHLIDDAESSLQPDRQEK